MRNAVVVLAFLTLWCAGVSSQERPARLVVLSWDGTPDWVLDRLLAEGELPHLAELARRGAVAEHSVTSFPSKTAPGHAAVWTGCWPGCNAVTANDVPASLEGEATLLELRHGFDFDALAAEPLFVTAAKAGLEVVVLSATHNVPARPLLDELRAAGVAEQRLVSFSGFQHSIAEARVYGKDDLKPADPDAWGWPSGDTGLFELTLTAGDSTLYALFFDDPADPATGLDTALIRQADRSAAGATASALLKPHEARPGTAAQPPRGWSPPFRVHRGEHLGHTFFRLFALGSEDVVLYQRDAHGFSGAYHPARLEAYLAAYPGFHDNPFYPYKDGRFGPPLMAGGDGTAERRLVEATAFDAALLRRGTRFVLESWRPDVLFHYTPTSDNAGHTWIGALDPRSPVYDPELAERLWPFYAEIFRQLDAWLGDIVDAAGPEALVALVSDHGMAGTSADVHTNHVLERAGLLLRDEAGEIDLARTRILAADSAFFLRLNDRRFRGGIVADEERESVIEAAAAALTAARDPTTGARLFDRVFRPDELRESGIDDDGPASPARMGDLYLDPAPGYYPDQDMPGSLVTSMEPWGEGNHGFHPERREMHAIFYLAGPGVRRGAAVGPVRHIDVAPTLSRLLGIPAPAQSKGRVVEALLVPRSRP